MASVDAIIEEYVNRYNPEEAAEDYCTGIQAARGLSLQHVSKEDIERVAQPFLYKWGRMGRVLGQPKKFGNWRENLANAVSRDASLLQRYATIDLTDADLTYEKQHIGTLYESFRGAVGQVAATKCLHLFCPGFFPMWDTAIAEAARRERSGRGLGIAVKEFSTEDFCQFVEQIQGFIDENPVLISLLARRYGKTKVRIVDEVFWWATHRPLCLML